MLEATEFGRPGAAPEFESATQPFLRRVRLKNYKSIGQCDVELAPITFLVGRNAAGKSNFLEALSFVTDALQTSVEHALRIRGGLGQVRRRSTGHPRNFLIRLDLELGAIFADYGFEVTSETGGGFSIKHEKLVVTDHEGRRRAHFEREKDQVVSSVENPPAVLEDRLFLVNMSGLKDFRPIFDALLSMGFYNLNPDAMKELSSPDAGELLQRDGSNIASVISRLRKEEPHLFERIRDYVGQIVPGVEDVAQVTLGPKETLEFRQVVQGAQHPWKFYAQNMSDGTLRALGALVAVTQLADVKTPVRLVGIEEPETALHPAAAGALMDALEESGRTQILVTTHSPDLLEQAPIGSDRVRLLVVQADKGETFIGKADPASLEAMGQHLYTAGELLRLGQLELDPEDRRRQEQLRLEL